MARQPRKSCSRLVAAVERGSEHPLGEAIVATCARAPARAARGEGFQRGRRRRASRRRSPARGLRRQPAVHAQPAARWPTPQEAARRGTARRRCSWRRRAPRGRHRGGRHAEAELGGGRRRLQRLGLQVVMLTGDNRSTARGHRPRGGHRPRSAPRCSPTRRRPWCASSRTRASWWPWWATASTTPRRWPRPTSGIAIGTGTDVAMEAADVTLMRGDLRSVTQALALSRRHHAHHPPEPVLGLLLQRRADPGGGGGALFTWLPWSPAPPDPGGAAMAFSSVTVVSNSLRLRRFSAPQVQPEAAPAQTVSQPAT